MSQRAQRSKQRPRLGQNFLVSPAAQGAIVDALGDLSQRTVVEIGPGGGAITSLLASRARRLVAIELDRELAAGLRAQFAERTNVEILTQDVLKTDFASLRVEGEPKLQIVGNLPYLITSEILLHLFAAHATIERAVIMVQREVAERVAAHPGTRDYGLLTATAQLYARVENLLTLPPEAFSPPPQVHSSVLRLTMAPRCEELGVEPDPFLRFLRFCFAQKRKMLVRNLRNAGYEAGTISAALAGCGISASARAEELELERMACLFLRLRKDAEGSSLTEP
ncbi:MAG TPA: 16S rRNA (adenine(1518)-N(6)/adenine(1519)-N(6))-dimethyltransferase RsmA [Acidobacteriaceae bacterium]|jgi:16S rRNA (adenine1518-N6/adenine1519-N6)-dimethyltransferase|nr:16S rRNA (adenine(1518)-N(6)/adenine(1519)-N(6))-dimethyltransferase RsmA [Acidobacteriaceae bacterium]